MNQHLLYYGLVIVLIQHLSKEKVLVMAIPAIAVTNNVIKQIGVQTLLLLIIINIVHFMLQDVHKIRQIQVKFSIKNLNNLSLRIQRHSQ